MFNALIPSEDEFVVQYPFMKEVKINLLIGSTQKVLKPRVQLCSNRGSFQLISFFFSLDSLSV